MELSLLNKQAPVLSPQMIQSGKILQMGSLELLEYVTEAIQENPVLEFPEDQGRDREFEQMRKRLEWLESSNPQERYYRRLDRELASDSLANYQSPEMQEESLYSFLLDQLSALKLPPVLMKAARGIVESLNGSGYLDEPLEGLGKELRLPVRCMEEGLKIVQSLEPAGIGAGCLEECLCLQLERQGEDVALAKRIVCGHLDALSKNRYTQIARDLSADGQEVREACDLIRSLNPKPGSGFADRRSLSYITPDLLVDVLPDRLELQANDRYFPAIQISPYYKRLMLDTQDEDVKAYLTEKVQQAKWVVKSIQQRRSTLIRCAECILRLQEPFFRRGAGHLVPMRLSDVAGMLDIHESTVSRAVRNKYIQCSHGIFPMSYFFSRSLGGENGEEGEVSSDTARAMLKRLIREEDRKKPLSDQRISEKMAELGCPLSRRTVAKYRDELGIPAAAVRKEV